MTAINNEDAVSPVIGVILMVAITVILAAIIASFVFGSSSNVQKTKVVAATAQLENSGSIQIVYQGGQDDLSLSSINITSPNGTIYSFTKPDVGTSIKLIPPTPSDWPDGSKHVIVTGSFTDGASQIILDTFV